MVKYLASTALLAGQGVPFLMLALVDWLVAKANASERPHLMPARVICEFRAAIDAAWHGQSRPLSRLACTNWSRRSCGPV